MPSRIELFVALPAAAVDDERGDELVSALEAGAVAGARTWAIELDGAARLQRGEA